MNRIIKIYTEADTLFDSRRGILQHLMTQHISEDTKRKAEGDRLWDLHIAANYKNRRLDTFEFPHLGITREKFEKFYEQRAVSHWLMYYPTNFVKDLLPTVLDLEGLSDKPIDIKGIEVYVNTFPYLFDEELKQSFLDHCRSAFAGVVNVKLLDTDVREAGAGYYQQFDYVFKYDLLTSKHSKPFMNSLTTVMIPDVTFVVPDVLVKETDELTGPISDRIFAMSVLIAPALKLIPIKHQFYDYRE